MQVCCSGLCMRRSVTSRGQIGQTGQTVHDRADQKPSPAEQRNLTTARRPVRGAGAERACSSAQCARLLLTSSGRLHPGVTTSSAHALSRELARPGLPQTSTLKNGKLPVSAGGVATSSAPAFRCELAGPAAKVANSNVAVAASCNLQVTSVQDIQLMALSGSCMGRPPLAIQIDVGKETEASGFDIINHTSRRRYTVK